MKKIGLLILSFSLSLFSASAQSILRYTPSNGSGEVYTNLDSAYADAQNDDILYLSGNTFQFSSNAVEKRLQWVGAGVNSDSTIATGYTRINPINSSTISFIIRPNAGGSSFTGINFGGFRLNDCDVAGNINLVTFSRCMFMTDWISLSYNSNYAGSQLNYRFQECIFNTFVNGNGFSSNATSNITFDNCLFSKGLFRLRTGTYAFNNCVFWATLDSDPISQNSGCTFNSCIFWDGANANLLGGYMNESNVFDHCVFSHATIPVGGSGANPTIVNSCIANVTNLFVDTNGNYNYEDGDDYRLVAGSEALTAAAAGGQCGIYGGASPAKPGNVPYNPHVSSKNIAPATVNGLLNVNITTSAQSH
ncbi:MAG TPA: hypothetical protein PL185_11485 [Flavobacteriales bacterium]|nr:hypothetical protein [Flavobacteriales bacterium]HPH83191.1 hypothetical protein [Flavobacteriales bacterium]